MQLALFRTNGRGLDSWNGGIMGGRHGHEGLNWVCFARLAPPNWVCLYHPARAEAERRAAGGGTSQVCPPSLIRNRGIGCVSHDWPPNWLCLYHPARAEAKRWAAGGVPVPNPQSEIRNRDTASAPRLGQLALSRIFRPLGTWPCPSRAELGSLVQPAPVACRP